MLDTFPKVLRNMAASPAKEQIALQEKRYGIWQAADWAGFDERVRAFAQGLSTMGVGRGDVLAVLGDNRPEWLIAELGVQSLGGMSVGIYPTSIGEEIVHILTHAGITVIVAEDQEQVDKLIDLPSTIEKIIYYDPQGLELYDDPKLVEFTEVEQSGRVFEAEHPGWIDEQIDSGSGEDTAVLCTTSGTTGLPKLAMLSHRNLLSMGRNLTEVDPLGAEDRFVSFLPFAWVGEQMMALACGFQAGFTISFPEEAATVQSDMREIGPNVMFAPPGIWESMLSTVQVHIGEAGWLKKRVFSWGFDVGEEAADLIMRGEPLPDDLRFRLAVAEVVAMRPVRDQLGLTRIKRAYTGGAPLGPDVFRFFHAIGVNLKQIYGQTEICGIAVVHRDGDIKFNTVGTPIAGTEMRIADDGEILLHSPAVFQGYYRNPEATAGALDAEGWLHTGDAGFIDAVSYTHLTLPTIYSV